MAQSPHHHKPARLAVATGKLRIRTRTGQPAGNLVIIARKRITQRGRTRTTEVWGVLDPPARQELVAGLSRQFVGGLRKPAQYRRILAHGDLRAKIRGTQRTGFGIVIYEQYGGSQVAGHLTASQVVTFIGHIAQRKRKPATTYETRASK